MLMRARIKKGFTLLELIVVLVVLGIIALIAIPTFQSLIDSSSKRSSRGTAVNIVEGANLLAAEQGDVTDGAYLIAAINDLQGTGTCGAAGGATIASATGCTLDANGDTFIQMTTGNDDTGDQAGTVMVRTKAGNNSGGYTCIMIHGDDNNGENDKAYIVGSQKYDNDDPTSVIVSGTYDAAPKTTLGCSGMDTADDNN